jgi:broad specificity phosphatase PhoE
MKNIYLFRHGETEWNKLKKFQGIVDIDLTETGIEQAKNIPIHLKDKDIKVIYSSPLKRALKTGQITAKELGIDIIINENLKEVNAGDAAGVKAEDLDKLFGENIWEKWQSTEPEYDNISFPNAETKPDFRKRIVDTITEIANNCKYGLDTIGIACHGFVLKQLMIAIGETENCRGIKNCEILHFTFNQKGYSKDNPVKSLNFIKRIRTDI